MTIAMGLVANYPIALAAGLGINGVVAFGLALGAGLGLAGAMGVIVREGIVVTVLVLVGLREAIMNAVPLSLKRAIGVGIGLFILFIGFVDGGLITSLAGSDAGPRATSHVRLPEQLGHVADRHRPGHHVRAVCAQGSGRADHQHHHHHRSSRSSWAYDSPAAGLIQAPNFSTLGQFDLVQGLHHARRPRRPS